MCLQRCCMTTMCWLVYIRLRVCVCVCATYGVKLARQAKNSGRSGLGPNSPDARSASRSPQRLKPKAKSASPGQPVEDLGEGRAAS